MTLVERTGLPDIFDTDAVIWRYLSLPKFLDLVLNKHLVFAPLSSMKDSFEGSLPVGLHENLVEALSFLHQANPSMLEKVETLRNDGRRMYYEMARSGYFLNCWFRSESESSALWNEFAPDGVAIRSSLFRLRDALNLDDEYDVWVGAVEYVDPADRVLFRTPNINSVLLKRPEFRHEQEVRAIIHKETQKSWQHGQPVVKYPIDLHILIERVIISPFSSNWLKEVIKSLSEMQGIAESLVLSSSLDCSPY